MLTDPATLPTEGPPKEVAVAIDDWKLPIFERHLKQSGYAFKNEGQLTPGTLLLRVETTNPRALHAVVEAANNEAKRTGRPQ